MPTQSILYRFGPFELTSTPRILKRSGVLLTLPPKAVDTLFLLVENSGEVVDKQDLFRSVWPGVFLAESSLTKNISILRKILDDPNGGESSIQTVPKRGYRLILPVDRCDGHQEHSPAAVPETVSLTPPAPARSMVPLRALLVTAMLLVAVALYWRHDTPDRVLAEADREYLIGRYMWSKFERSELQKALERFQKAVELAPGSALAHAGLADAYTSRAMLGVGKAATNLARARAAAERAVALDDRLARPHVSLGHVRLLADFDWKAAEAEFQRAIHLDRRLAPAYHGYACLLAHSGRLSEAREAIQRAQQLDPVSPLVAVAAARIEYYARRYQHAVSILRDVLEREPSFSPAHYYLAMSLGQLGRTDEALVHLRESRVHAGLLATDEAWLAAVNGNRNQARTLLAERRKLVANGADPVTMLLPAVDAGEFDTAFSSLEQMTRARRIELVTLKVNPRFDPLRSDPRFDGFVRRLWPD
jgi:DNA-binding winged helix-turn-helix (wHTH) protein/Flp pilus assembly protein TadD